MSSTTYLLRPEQYSWLVKMAEAHNLGFTNKTLKETVDYELKYQRRAVEARVRALHRRRLERSNWKKVRNCRLPDRTAREVASIANTYKVDFMDTLSVIVADAVSRINRDRTLEDTIFETPRSTRCTSTLIRDLQRQRQRHAPSSSSSSSRRTR